MTPTINPPPIYIYIRRQTQVDPRTGLYEGPAVDLFRFHHPDLGVIDALGRTLPTHRAGKSPPVILPGWYPDAYVVGQHAGRLAWVQQGTTSVRYRRHDGTVGDDYTGLNLHSWKGDSNGCLTTVEAWIRATIGAAWVSDLPLHPSTGEPMVGLLLEDVRAEMREAA